MKKILLYALGSMLVLLTALWVLAESQKLSAQPLPAAQTAPVTELNTQDFAIFRRQVMPLINEMADKKVVSLGEGTHGTSEFYKVRYWITRILVEEKGFTTVAFENDYADSYLVDRALAQGRTDYPALMREGLLSIWQNQEVAEMLQWLQAHNRPLPRRRQVQFSGLDNVYQTNDARLLQKLVAALPAARLQPLAARLVQIGVARDSMWNNSNDKTFQLSEQALNQLGAEGYQTAMRTQHLLSQLPLRRDLREQTGNLLANMMQSYIGSYEWLNFKRGAALGRDSSMADMACRLVQQPGRKLIIWAHDGHVARKSVFGGYVGGMGGFISKQLQGSYYALGTGTATGTFAATDEPFDTRTNPMRRVALEVPPTGLWEDHLARLPQPAFYFTFGQGSPAPTASTFRLIGYGPDSGKNSHDHTRPLHELYDAYLFIRETQAAHPLQTPAPVPAQLSLAQ